MKKLALLRLKSPFTWPSVPKFVAATEWNESAGQSSTLGVLNSFDITWNTLP